MNDAEKAFIERGKQAVDRFDDAMCDDLNTSEAMGVVFEYVRDMNTQLTDANAPCKAVLEEGLKMLAEMTDVLGLLSKEYDATPEDIKVLVEARTAAKKAKDFAEADRIRDELAAKGITLIDTPNGTTYKIG
jgi:cysteinyl-tRNA synthetase